MFWVHIHSMHPAIRVKTMKQLFIELGASLASEKPIRNIIKPYISEVIEEFRGKHNNIDVFTSVFRYDNEEIRKAKQFGPLYFDLDGEYAQDDLRALINFLTQHKCPSSTIQVYYSGNKGFHLELPFRFLGIEGDQKLNKLYEVIAKEIKSTIHAPSLDTGIYDAVRLWRLPNSINSKSGLYKIPLMLEEAKLPLDQIKALAKTPRNDFQHIKPEVWNEFADILEKAKRKLKNSTYKGGVLEPVEEGQRNDATFRRAIKLKAQGKTFEETVEVCGQIQDKPPLPLSEIRRTVASAYQDKYAVEVIKSKRSEKEEGVETTSFLVTQEGLICEEVYDPKVGEPVFAVFDGEKVEYLPSIKHFDKIAKPIGGIIVTSRLVKLPTEVTDYGDELELFNNIRNFIHTYVDLDENWEYWASYYVLLSWIYDKLPVCPYLCALGASSTGKTRFIQTVGTICYKPFTASGSITASPIFRILDQFRGTLIVNEFDHIGEFNAEIIVIFNNGFEDDLPVTRTEGEERKEVKVFQVYGPKLFSSRNRKSDWAFESRLITIHMKETQRKDIPPFLLEDFHKRAMELRNMLLMFRFKHYNKERNIRMDLFPNIKGRLKQTLLSITSVIQDEVFLEKANEFAKQLEKNLKTVKEFDLDAFIYQVLKECWEDGERTPAIKDVVEKVKKLADWEKLTSKAVGNIVRDEFGFETRRGGSSGNYVIELSSEQLDYIKERYEVVDHQEYTSTPEQSSVTSVSSVIDTHNTEVTEQPELTSNTPVTSETSQSKKEEDYDQRPKLGIPTWD